MPGHRGRVFGSTSSPPNSAAKAKSPATSSVKRGSSSLPIAAQCDTGLVYEVLPSLSVVSIWMRVRLGLISGRCQTVPLPFGSGTGDSGVAPWNLHSLLVFTTIPDLRRSGGTSASVLNSSDAATVYIEGRTGSAECQGVVHMGRACGLVSPLL